MRSDGVPCGDGATSMSLVFPERKIGSPPGALAAKAAAADADAARGARADAPEAADFGFAGDPMEVERNVATSCAAAAGAAAGEPPQPGGAADACGAAWAATSPNCSSMQCSAFVTGRQCSPSCPHGSANRESTEYQDAKGTPGFQTVPIPPVAVITSSDGSIWPKLKLQELFIEWLLSVRNVNWILQVVDCLASERGATPELDFGQMSRKTSSSGLPETFLSHLPFGRVVRSVGGRADSETFGAGDSGDSGIYSALGLTSTRTDMARSNGNAAALQNGESVAPTLVHGGTASSTDVDVPRRVGRVIQDGSAPGSSSPNSSEDGVLRVQPLLSPSTQGTPAMPDTKASLTDPSETSPLVARGSSPSADASLRDEAVSRDSALSSDKASAVMSTSESRPMDAEDLEARASDPRGLVQNEAVLSTEQMVDKDYDPVFSAVSAVNRKGDIDQFYFPQGKKALERENMEVTAAANSFRAHRTKKGYEGITKSEFEDLFVACVGLPKFLSVLVFDSLIRSAKFTGNSPSVSGDGNVLQGGGLSKGTDASSDGLGVQSSMNSDGISGNGETQDAFVSGGESGSDQRAADSLEGVRDVQLVSEKQFMDFYASCCKSVSLEARLYELLLPPGAGRDHLVPSDLKPLLRALLSSHQGLAFLHATPEFQLRYAETVVERIFYSCSRHGKGRLTLRDIKRCGLLDTLFFVDKEDDINRERRYFSYEHFYVLYCRFWELDTDHDLQIDREDLMRYGGHALTYRIVDRVFLGYARQGSEGGRPKYMSYADFIWFCLSEEDKHSETALDYWYQCVDLDGDGLISLYDMEYFYTEQLHRMECLGHEPVQVRDILCQLLDMVKPNCNPPIVSRSDLKSSHLSGSFFNILFNLTKFFALETRDPLQIRQEHATPELSDWDRFAALEYLRLSAEEEADEEDGWDDVGDISNTLLSGEAPF